jgi:AraC family transcriptional activator of mtrCDE
MIDEAEIFGQLAPLLRVRPELQFICRFGGAQWRSAHGPEPKGWAPFHIVTHGTCMVDVENGTDLQIEAGDVVVFSQGGRHTLHGLSRSQTPSSEIRIQRRLYDELVIKTNVEGEPDTKIICGRFCFEQVHDNIVLAALPPIVVLRARGARLRRIVEGIRDELEEDGLGAAAIAASLASSLMVIVLTTYFESTMERRGVLALLTQRQTARVFAAMLSEPARTWTLDQLAEQANTSRATLVRMFQKAVNAAPLTFLADLRLNLARHRILTTKTPLALIAEEVGYQSESAFSRAYNRRFGVSPGSERKGGEAGATANQRSDAKPANVVNVS